MEFLASMMNVILVFGIFTSAFNVVKAIVNCDVDLAMAWSAAMCFAVAAVAR